MSYVERLYMLLEPLNGLSRLSPPPDSEQAFTFVNLVGYILIIWGVKLFLVCTVFFVKSFLKKRNNPLSVIGFMLMSCFGLYLIYSGILMSGTIVISEYGYYGCPNSKRIAKLNIKKRMKRINGILYIK